MENFERGEELTLDDNSKYMVVDSFIFNDKHYLYLISEDDEKTVAIVENINGTLNEITDEHEYQIVFNELVRRNQDEIRKYIEEIDEN